MADEPFSLDQFETTTLASEVPIEVEEKVATDLQTVFDVPVNISAVLGKAHLSVAQLLKLNQGSVLASGRPDDIIANESVRRVYLGEHFRM